MRQGRLVRVQEAVVRKVGTPTSPKGCWATVEVGNRLGDLQREVVHLEVRLEALLEVRTVVRTVVLGEVQVVDCTGVRTVASLVSWADWGLAVPHCSCGVSGSRLGGEVFRAGNVAGRDGSSSGLGRSCVLGLGWLGGALDADARPGAGGEGRRWLPEGVEL